MDRNVFCSHVFVNKLVWKSNVFAVKFPQIPSQLESNDTSPNLA